MRFSIDTNVLVYAFEPHEPRDTIACRVMADAVMQDCILTNQVLGEFLKVSSGRYPDRRDMVRRDAADWTLLYTTVPTNTGHLIAAAEMAEPHLLQFWDSLVITVARSAGAEVLVTEDMQDGSVIDGVRLLNPFDPTNAELLDQLLTPAPGTA